MIEYAYVITLATDNRQGTDVGVVLVASNLTRDMINREALAQAAKNLSVDLGRAAVVAFDLALNH